MRFGTRFIGAVEALGEESIRTRFRMLIVPLWPIESHFVLQDSFEGFRSFPVPLNRKSIALGYLRWWSFLGIVVGGLFYWERSAYLLLTYSFFVWSVSSICLGGCSSEERKERQILKHTTGISAPPELQPDEMRHEISQTLNRKLEELLKRLDVESWQVLANQPGGEKAAAFAYAAARYANACEEDSEHQAQMQASWTHIKNHWNYWINSFAH